MNLCLRCNRKLKSQKSIDAGMGPTCKKKHDKELVDAELEKNQITLDEVMDKPNQSIQAS